MNLAGLFGKYGRHRIPPRGGYSETFLVSLQMVGMLSALIFTFNVCLEIFALFSLGRNHQILILLLQMSLAAWALLETVLLRSRQSKLSLDRLFALLIVQLLVESFRLILLFLGPHAGVGRSYGVGVIDLGSLGILVPVYVLLFFSISKALLAAYGNELTIANEKLTMAAIAESRQKEREELLQDMHDGFGSQLQSARLLIENSQMSQQQLLDVIGECVEDLYLVVDLLSNKDQRLQDALVDYRHRMQYRTADLPSHVRWYFSLADCPPLPERVILQLLRIVQEAVNNALKHAGPCNIVIAAEFRSSEELVISVVDDGLGLLDSVKSGRGLNNMKKRAQLMGASLSIERRSPSGTAVELRLGLEELSA